MAQFAIVLIKNFGSLFPKTNRPTINVSACIEKNIGFTLPPKTIQCKFQCALISPVSLKITSPNNVIMLPKTAKGAKIREVTRFWSTIKDKGKEMAKKGHKSSKNALDVTRPLSLWYLEKSFHPS
jgi:hypothetical protein